MSISVLFDIYSMLINAFPPRQNMLNHFIYYTTSYLYLSYVSVVIHSVLYLHFLSLNFMKVFKNKLYSIPSYSAFLGQQTTIFFYFSEHLNHFVEILQITKINTSNNIFLKKDI